MYSSVLSTVFTVYAAGCANSHNQQIGSFVYYGLKSNTIEFEYISEEDAAELKTIIEKHVLYTESKKGAKLLADWDTSLDNFVKVMPTEYKRALERIASEEPMFEELTKA